MKEAQDQIANLEKVSTEQSLAVWRRRRRGLRRRRARMRRVRSRTPPPPRPTRRARRLVAEQKIERKQACGRRSRMPSTRRWLRRRRSGDDGAGGGRAAHRVRMPRTTRRASPITRRRRRRSPTSGRRRPSSGGSYTRRAPLSPTSAVSTMWSSRRRRGVDGVRPRREPPLPHDHRDIDRRVYYGGVSPTAGGGELQRRRRSSFGEPRARAELWSAAAATSGNGAANAATRTLTAQRRDPRVARQPDVVWSRRRPCRRNQQQAHVGAAVDGRCGRPAFPSTRRPHVDGFRARAAARLLGRRAC